MSPTILVTGVSGFIGKKILARLSVHAIGLQRSADVDRGTIYFCDLLDSESVNNVVNRLQGTHFTHLIHTAGITPWVKNAQFDDDVTIANSVINLCHGLHISNLINLSGWNVYDMSGKPPFSESTSIKPVGEYGESKYKVEQFLAKYADGVRVLNLRLASIYGPGQVSPGLIPNSVSAALNDKKIKLRSLDTRRDYLYIDDLTNLIDQIVSTPGSVPEGVLNVGSGSSVSTSEVAEVIKELVESEFDEIVSIETDSAIQESELIDNQLDIRKANKLHLLQDTFPIKKGLLNYIQWIKNENIL